jgi:inorganic pyrophosphatase
MFKLAGDRREAPMIQVLIQVAAGSCDRKIYNERTLEYLETRSGSRPYPYPYGFVVGTSAEDGACVDCYLITSEKVSAGAIVECEPIGLLLQDEAGEMDHKVLAALPGQEAAMGPELLQEMQTFICAIFAGHPELRVRVGPILPREAALDHLQRLFT